MAIGVSIRDRRRAAGLSQAELSKAVGVAFQQIQKYESGINRMSFSRLVMLAQALGCRIRDLIGDVDADWAPVVGLTIDQSVRVFQGQGRGLGPLFGVAFGDRVGRGYALARKAVGERTWRRACVPGVAASPCPIAVEGGGSARHLAPEGRILLQWRKGSAKIDPPCLPGLGGQRRPQPSGGGVGIISARSATPRSVADMEMVRKTYDPNNPPKFSDERRAQLDAMTDGELVAPAGSDPDNRPMTDAEWARGAPAGWRGRRGRRQDCLGRSSPRRST
ncbi:MAG: helix-turn-helix transcriptional regulator [Caulobacteraceae bacterium]|nr:helix-turn-helix transcriptional regulator [Caulobacteraceae bacterium]